MGSFMITRRLLLPIALALALVPGTALAHNPPTPATVWSAWAWDPFVLTWLGLLIGAYTVGSMRLWRRSGAGRKVRLRASLYFAAAILTLIVAIISPLDAFAHALFSAHMVQHLLLILVAAPLLVLARPLPTMLWALHGTRGLPAVIRPLVRGLTALLRSVWFAPLAWVLHAAALWFWHMPRAYDAAVADPFVHALEHLAFFGTAVLFWWAVFGPAGAGRIDRGVGVLYTFTMAVQGSILAALLTFAPTNWYSAHGAGVVIWRLAHPTGEPTAEGLFICGPVDPVALSQAMLEDQQLAGLLMWIPSGIVYTLVALWLLAAWLKEAEQRSLRRAAHHRLKTRLVCD
jgi:putative membrane protein